MTPATITGLVLDAIRAMSPAERHELRELLDIDETEPDRWMDSRDAAAYLGVHRDTLRKLAAAGSIRSMQDGPACKHYFSKAALDRWRESGGRFHAASTPQKAPASARRLR